MKKVILSLAILVATSFASFAAIDNKTENTTSVCKSKTECLVNGTCPDNSSCTAKKEKTPKCCKAFEGIDLSAEQKAKLAELRKSCIADREKNKVSKDKKSNLSDEQKKQLKAERKAKHLEARKKYLENVKAILTPEQYNQFLENSYLSSHHKKADMKGKGAKMHRKGDGKRFGRKGDKNKMASKTDRQNKNAA